jgi:hypothetical protein
VSFNEAVKKGWTSESLFENRADCFFSLGYLDNAVADCDSLLALAGEGFSALATRGAACIGLRRYEEAAQDLKTACEKDPSSDWPRANLAWCTAFGDAVNRAAALDMLLVDSLEDPWSIVLRAMVHGRHADVGQAELRLPVENEDSERLLTRAILAGVEGDEATATRLAAEIVASQDEGRIRWLRIHLDNFQRRVPTPAFIAALAVGDAGLERLAFGPLERVTEADVPQSGSDKRELKIADFPEDSPEDVRHRLPIPNGMLCRLSSVHGFGREKKFAEALLERENVPRAAVAWMLEDGEHVYVQSNVLWSEEDAFCFKLIGPLQPLLDQRILSDQIIRGKQLETVFFLDDESLRRLSNHGSTRPLAGKFKRLTPGSSGEAFA